MKKFLVAFIITCSLLGTSSFAYTEKILHGSSGELFVTVNPEHFNVTFEDYDMPKVTCVLTGKSHVFKSGSDAYFIEGSWRFDKSIIDKLQKAIILDFAKTITVA